MTLWPHLVVIPGLFKTTEAHICCRHLGNDAVEALITRILRQSTTLLIWHKRHETELEPPKALAPSEHDTSDSTRDMLSVLKQIRRKQLRNSYLIGLLILSRLLSALAPARLTYWEKRTQSLAHQIAETASERHDAAGAATVSSTLITAETSAGFQNVVSLGSCFSAHSGSSDVSIHVMGRAKEPSSDHSMALTELTRAAEVTRRTSCGS